MPRTPERKKVRNTTLYLDESHWAALLAKLTSRRVPEVLSRYVRKGLRAELSANGIDPDAWWEKNGK